MEHITVAKAFAGESVLDPNQEMISIGVSNILGSFARCHLQIFIKIS